MQVEKVVYSVPEVAALLGVSRDKVYQLVRANQLPHKRVGRQIRIPVRLFQAWIAEPTSWSSVDG